MWKSQRHLTTAITLTIVGLVASTALAQVPTTTQVIGALTGPAGGPATDGDYTMTFSLYAKAIGGKATWLEGPVKISVKNGRFVHELGKLVPLKAAVLNSGSASWFGVAIAGEPELPRSPVQSAFFARRAGVASAVDCTGCLTGSQVGFTYAGSKTKGGAAEKALDLACTGCVSVAELKIDADLDLGGQALKAKKVVASEVAAGTVSANSFVGDGSKLTGIKTPAGTCAKAGQVVKGIDPTGKLICVAAMDPSALPSDGLDEISGGLLTNEFVHTISSAKPMPIPDNNPTGVGGELNFPDVGVAKKLTVTVKLKNSNVANVAVHLYDPNNVKYVLYNKGGKGNSLSGTWPAPDKTISGDLGTWVGKNPKGKWRLVVIDDKFFNNKDDGQVDSWSVSSLSVSNGQVEATKDLLVSGLLKANGGLLYKVAAKEPVKCTPALSGYTYFDSTTKALRICNGSSFYSLYLVLPGSKENPISSCKELLDQAPQTKTGVYWLDTDGPGSNSPAFEAYCDMDTDGGGWTLLGTVSGADANNWNTEKGYWADTKLLGKISAPWLDYKSQAWVSLPIAKSEILFQRRYAGSVRSRTILATACQGGKSTFKDLFTTWNTSIKCGLGSINVIQKPKDASGISGSSYVEGSSDGLGGSSTNGWCWNGGDSNSNIFKGHAGWNQKGYNCYASGHLGYIAVWSKSSSQYKKTDIDGTNWLYNTSYGKTEISFFAR